MKQVLHIFDQMQFLILLNKSYLSNQISPPMTKDILKVIIAASFLVFVATIDYVQRRVIQSEYLIKRVTYSQDETILLMVSDFNNSVLIYDAIFMRKMQTLNLTFQPVYSSISPKNNYIAIRAMNYKITFFAKNGTRFTEEPVSVLLMQHAVLSIGFSQDQNTFYVGDSTGLVYVYQIEKTQNQGVISLNFVSIKTIDFANGVRQLTAFSIFQKKGKLLVAGGDYVHGKIALYNPKNSFSLIRYVNKLGTYARFSSDMSLIVSIEYEIDGNGTAYILDAQKLQMIQIVFLPLLHEYDIKISGNGNFLTVYGQIEFTKKALVILQRLTNPMNWTEKELIPCRTGTTNAKADQVIIVGDQRISDQIERNYQQGYLSKEEAQNLYVSNQYTIIDFSFCSQEKFYDERIGNCQPCQKNCKICQNDNLCYQCLSQHEYFDKTTNLCVSCKQPCVTCLTEEKCLSCRINFIFDKEKYTCTQQESALVIILIAGISGLAILLLLAFSVYKTIQYRKNKNAKDEEYSKIKTKKQSGLIQHPQER